MLARIDSEQIDPLNGYQGAEPARWAARYCGSHEDDMMAPVVSNRRGGNPFYISALIRLAAKEGNAINDEKNLDEFLDLDLSSGFILAELNDQAERLCKN